LASVPSCTWAVPCSLELYGICPALTGHTLAAVLNCRRRRVRHLRRLAPGRRRAVWNRATLAWPLVKHLPWSGTMVGGVFGAMPLCTWAGSCGLEPCNARLITGKVFPQRALRVPHYCACLTSTRQPACKPLATPVRCLCETTRMVARLADTPQSFRLSRIPRGALASVVELLGQLRNPLGHSLQGHCAIHRMYLSLPRTFSAASKRIQFTGMGLIECIHYY
jgi:hypothetical protein